MPHGPTSPEIALFGEILADVFPDHRVPGGAPFNVARHLRALGLHPRLISRIGKDALGESLLAEMLQRGMDVTAIQRDAHRPTGQVQVIIAREGHRFDILPDQAYDHISGRDTCAALATMAPRLAYFGTLALRQPVSRAAAEDFLRHCDCPVFLDINLRPPWVDAETVRWALAAADIAKLNTEELAEVSSWLGFGESSAEQQAARLQRQFELRRVLITCGKAGAWQLDEDRTVQRATSPEVADIVDTVGAGDAFAAVFMQGLLTGQESATTLQRACNYAAAQCRVRGAAPPEPENP